MYANRRHHAILVALRRDGGVRASDLAVDLDVSAITIRRDLAELEQRGHAVRVRGGAVLPEGAEPVPGLSGHRVAIGMVVPGTAQYFREVAEGARRAAQARDVALTLAVSEYNLEADRLNGLLDAGVDGLLLTPSEPFSRMPPDAVDWLSGLPVPVLFVERYSPTVGPVPIEFVASDHRHGAMAAMGHLADLGHRRVALVTCQSPTSGWLTLGYDAAVSTLHLADDVPRYEDRTREELLGDLDPIMDSFIAVLPTDPLVRYRNGKPLTTRRYDHLWHRLGQQLPWIATQGISTHWLRHTTLTWVERHFGYGIARAYAGHTDNNGPATTTYLKANLQEVATALARCRAPPARARRLAMASTNSGPVNDDGISFPSRSPPGRDSHRDTP